MIVIGKGMLIGSVIGSLRGGIAGGLIGGIIGHFIEMKFFAKRSRGASGVRRRTPSDPLEKAYRVLHAKPTDDDETLNARYRELVKKYHPDVLCAQGRSEREIAAATEKMSSINAAWAKIKAARNIGG